MREYSFKVFKNKLSGVKLFAVERPDGSLYKVELSKEKKLFFSKSFTSLGELLDGMADGEVVISTKRVSEDNLSQLGLGDLSFRNFTEKLMDSFTDQEGIGKNDLAVGTYSEFSPFFSEAIESLQELEG